MVENFMRQVLVVLMGLMLIQPGMAAGTDKVRIKELARIQGIRDYPLVGYGVIVGLSGTGDSEKNRVTRQSLVNVLKHFNVSLTEADLNSRNTAAVMVTSRLGAYGEAGDKLDVEVASLGDARSLQGGSLLMTPLYGPDQKLYALAQGALSVGGYDFEANDSSRRKNHPTAGRIPRGANVERHPEAHESSEKDKITLILNEPDFTTAQRIADGLTRELALNGVEVIHGARIEIPVAGVKANIPQLISRIENISVTPDHVARVIVNEKTGTVVSGGQVRIDEVSISHGNLNVEISTRYQVSQPGWLAHPGDGVGTVVVPDTKLSVTEQVPVPVQLKDGTTVGELVQAMYRIHLSTRDVITVLQAINQAGALHAELIIQ
ncbi:MAG: flagellar basal body P-ring protein FlgI [Fluviicoccus sp.]|uniref:flagellar basal body P-ring protein FlgI n=1 Tax=Fluviicoccus sp. TaxID=2003552 RepID=UPI00271F03E6|nr:flagellar basal body P-ring protein FlgI [Fluviicoccus sp.]MDO8330482.1 flagellar basal body P-ring protein FlgI [Fluviicoccus sp.]